MRPTLWGLDDCDGPVPDDSPSESWVAVFFQKLATAMAEAPSLPWGVACAAYLDSVSDATIDGQYLKLHVALEAFGTALLKQDEQKRGVSPLLVKDGKAWVGWVKDHAVELREMLAEPAREDAFVGKLIAAMNLPSSSVVADALLRLDPAEHPGAPRNDEQAWRGLRHRPRRGACRRSSLPLGCAHRPRLSI